MLNKTTSLLTEFFTDDKLFAKTVLNIKPKDMVICPFILNRAQRHAYTHLARRNLYLKARQLGFSTYIQARTYRRNIAETSTSITISDVGDNTIKLRSIYNRFHDLWPEHLIDFRPVRARDSIAWVTYPHNQSESGIITAGARTGGRGGTASIIHGSEVGFWPNATEIFSATLQSATPDAEIHLESTANGQQGMFYEMCMEALGGNPDWYLHFYPWWWADEYAIELDAHEEIVYTDEELNVIRKASDGGFDLTPEQIKWRRAKKREPGMAHLFAQEYPESPYDAFLSGGGTVFGAIDHCIKAPIEPVPQPGHRYVAGGDWGQSDDFSAISIMDATIDKEVFIDHFNKMDWEEMQRRMVDACIKWGVETFQPEYNSIGRVNAEALRKMFENKGYDINLRPIETTNDKKRKWVQNFYNGLHNEGLQLLDKDYATAELRGFSQKQLPSGAYQYAAAGSGHDDTVIARLLAYDALCKVIG